jgi:MurNAc alpha-1-phosphate uridylyltransferase
VQAVILAGGLGRRMHPQTSTLPKSLLPVAGRPFIAWQLEQIAASGIDRVLLCLGHLGEAIEQYVRNGSAFGLSVDCAHDGPKLLGTAGALRQALDRLDETFIVTYGDSYLPFDYSAPLADLRAHPEARGTMAVYRNQGRWDASNTAVQGEQVVRYAKGHADPALDHIDYGATALRREVIAKLPQGRPWGLDAVQAELVAQGLLRAWRARERFFEIGSADGLRDLETRLGGKT